MANPRYYPPQQRESRKEKNLALALQLSGVGQDQQQISDRAQNARVAQAIQLLGLQQQAETDKARQQQAMDMLGLQKQQATSQDQFQTQTLTNQQTHQDAVLREAQANRQGDEAFRTQQLGQNADAQAMQFVSRLMDNPNVPMNDALSFLPQSQQPNVQRMHDAGTQTRIGQAMQTIGPLYAANQNDPAKIANALKMLEPTFATQPEVWNGLPWDQLNQNLTPPAAPNPAAPQGVGGSLGYGIRNAPQLVGGALDGAERAMTNFGSNFWLQLLGLTPKPPDTRPFQETVNQSKAWPWQ